MKIQRIFFLFLGCGMFSIHSVAATSVLFFPLGKRADIILSGDDGEAKDLYLSLNADEVVVAGYRGKAVIAPKTDFWIDCMTPVTKEQYVCKLRVLKGPNAIINQEKGLVYYKITGEESAEMMKFFRTTADAFEFYTHDGLVSLLAKEKVFVVKYDIQGKPE